MSKNKKGENPAQTAAKKVEAQPAPTEKKTEVAVIQIDDLGKLAQERVKSGLDPNHVVDLLKMLHETYRTNPNAAKVIGVSQDAVDKVNRITAIAQVAVLANEMTYAQTPFAVSMRVSQFEAIKEVMPLLGITIDEKALPAPKNGVVELPTNAVKVSKETEKKIKEEQEVANKKVELDPSKIKNEEDLKTAVLHILVKGNGSENLYDKIATAIDFYKSYLGIQAASAENPEEAKKAIGDKSRGDLLVEITRMLGKCTFSISGAAKYMFDNTERTKNPIVAFTMFRDASLNKKTGMPQIDDQLVADITKALITWHGESEIATAQEVIAGFERDIELLKKDSKKNKKGIEDGAKKIENANKRIEAIKAVIGYANVPDHAFVETFPADYVNDKSENYKFDRMIGSKIINTYYGNDVKPGDFKQEQLVHNLQQYAGIILNFFLPPLNHLANYSEANIVELEKQEVKEPEKNQ